MGAAGAGRELREGGVILSEHHSAGLSGGCFYHKVHKEHEGSHRGAGCRLCGARRGRDVRTWYGPPILPEIYTGDRAIDMASNIYQPFSFMKQTFTCVSYDECSFVMEWTMEPKGFVPTHYHEFMDEHFDVVSGEGEFVIDGEKRIARSGDRLSVAKGIKHSIRTASTSPLVCRVEYSPCSDTHKMFAIFGGLQHDGEKGITFLMKAEYICRRAGLERFSTSPGMMGAIETGMMGLVKPIASLRRWHQLADKYLTE